MIKQPPDHNDVYIPYIVIRYIEEENIRELIEEIRTIIKDIDNQNQSFGSTHIDKLNEELKANQRALQQLGFTDEEIVSISSRCRSESNEDNINKLKRNAEEIFRIRKYQSEIDEKTKESLLEILNEGV